MLEKQMVLQLRDLVQITTKAVHLGRLVENAEEYCHGNEVLNVQVSSEQFFDDDEQFYIFIIMTDLVNTDSNSLIEKTLSMYILRLGDDNIMTNLLEYYRNFSEETAVVRSTSRQFVLQKLSQFEPEFVFDAQYLRLFFKQCLQHMDELMDQKNRPYDLYTAFTEMGHEVFIPDELLERLIATEQDVTNVEKKVQQQVVSFEDGHWYVTENYQDEEQSFQSRADLEDFVYLYLNADINFFIASMGRFFKDKEL